MSLEGQGSTANPVGLGVPVMVQGTWGAPKIYPEVAGMLDNPDAAFAKLRELGQGLFGNAAGGGQAGSGNIIQGIGDMLKNLGNSPHQLQRTSQPHAKAMNIGIANRSNELKEIGMLKKIRVDVFAASCAVAGLLVLHNRSRHAAQKVCNPLPARQRSPSRRSQRPALPIRSR